MEEVLQLLVQHGAHPDILVDAHPHIGSDCLPHVIKSMRTTIIGYGGDVRFETRADSLIIEDGCCKGVVTDAGEEIHGEAVILATGHSAHDTFRRLHSSGVLMEAKGIAIGVRLESMCSHSSLIYNSQKLERTQMSFKRGMDNENVVHLHNEVLVSY